MGRASLGKRGAAMADGELEREATRRKKKEMMRLENLGAIVDRPQLLKIEY